MSPREVHMHVIHNVLKWTLRRVLLQYPGHRVLGRGDCLQGGRVGADEIQGHAPNRREFPTL